jgi:hypothetical protein
MMFSTWKDKIKPKLLKYYDAIRQKYVTLKEQIKEALEIDIKTAAEKLHMSEVAKERLMNKIAMIHSEDPKKLLDETLVLFHRTYLFLLRLRSTFFCSICDFDNHAAFNLV